MGGVRSALAPGRSLRLIVTVIAVVAAGMSSGQGPDTPAALELTEAERAWLAAHPVIRLGPYRNYRPAEFLDDAGQHQGIAA